MGDSGQLPIGRHAGGQPLPPGVRAPDPTLGRLRPVAAPARREPVAPETPVPRPAKRAKVVPKVRRRASLERMTSEPPKADEIDPPTKPKRERVVLADPSQSTSTTLRARVELAEQTSWGELLIKDLIRAQLRSGLALAALVVLLLGGLPLAFALAPSFASLTFVGVPVAWLVLGVLPFPLLFAVGLWYNSLADRHERAFVDMIEN
ncbi:MAG: hypothetical protein ACRDQ7_00450 [Haloechinothrix sp.]